MKVVFKHWKSLHSYMGLLLAGVFFILGFTGFLMLAPQMFGWKHHPVQSSLLLRWYDSPETRIKDYKKRETVTLFSPEGTPVLVASDHGAILVQESEGQWIKAKHSSHHLRVEERLFAKTEIRQEPLTWGKVITDLHSGEFFGGWLNLFYYLSALSLIGLTATGMYLWYIPWSQKRKRSLAVQKPASAERRVKHPPKTELPCKT